MGEVLAVSKRVGEGGVERARRTGDGGGGISARNGGSVGGGGEDGERGKSGERADGLHCYASLKANERCGWGYSSGLCKKKGVNGMGETTLLDQRRMDGWLYMAAGEASSGGSLSNVQRYSSAEWQSPLGHLGRSSRDHGCLYPAKGSPSWASS